MSIIYGNIVGGGSGGSKSFLIEDSDGNQFVGVVTEELTLLTAKASDIVAGKTAGTEDGIVTGTHTCE